MTNTNKLIEKNQLQATIDAINASQGEAIYQYQDDCVAWFDVEKSQYKRFKEFNYRIVYLAPPQVNDAYEKAAGMVYTAGHGFCGSNVEIVFNSVAESIRALKG